MDLLRMIKDKRHKPSKVLKKITTCALNECCYVRERIKSCLLGDGDDGDADGFGGT